MKYKFKVGDRIVDKEDNRKGTIIDREEYHKINDSKIAKTSQCVLFDGSKILMVIPDEDLKLDTAWLREERLKDLLDED